MRYSYKEKFLSFWELCPRPLTRGSAPGPPDPQIPNPNTALPPNLGCLDKTGEGQMAFERASPAVWWQLNFQRFKWLLNAFLFRYWDCSTLWLSVKAAPHKFYYLLTAGRSSSWLCLKVNVRASLYHGRENLCTSINSPEKRIMDSRTIEWHERLSFDLKLCDVPRMMRLCFMLYTTGDRRTKPQGKTGRLQTGGKTVRGDGKKVNWYHLCR